MKKNEVILLYDIFNKKEVFVSNTNAFGLSRQNLEDLKKERVFSCKKRFCLARNKHRTYKITNLVNGLEYECFDPSSMLIQLNINEKDKISAGAISAIIGGFAMFRSVADSVFCLTKNKNKMSNLSLGVLKNKSLFNDRLIKAKANRKIRGTISCRLNGVLKNIFSKKRSSILNYLGCSFKDFLSYLESQFQEGMSWSNYGKWHVDHIKPCNTYDLSIEEEQYKCFHYTNLRPLWAMDNWKRPKDGSDILINVMTKK